MLVDALNIKDGILCYNFVLTDMQVQFFQALKFTNIFFEHSEEEEAPYLSRSRRFIAVKFSATYSYCCVALSLMPSFYYCYLNSELQRLDLKMYS